MEGKIIRSGNAFKIEKSRKIKSCQIGRVLCSKEFVDSDEIISAGELLASARIAQNHHIFRPLMTNQLYIYLASITDTCNR